jgi:excisionase family DNA binding protein
MKANPAEVKRSNPLLVTANEVAAALSVSTRQVQYWQEEQRIPFHKFGRRCTRYNLAEVLKALGVNQEVAV